MKNLTLRIDEKVLSEARKQAALRGTTVAKLVREFLNEFVSSGVSDSVHAERLDRFLSRNAEAGGFAESPPPFEDQPMNDKIAERTPTLEEMTTDTGAPPEPGHDEWFRRQVQSTLDKKRAGKLKYRDLRDVAAEYGSDTRP